MKRVSYVLSLPVTAVVLAPDVVHARLFPWFHGELAERPPFDPGGYLVGVDEATGAYAGLIRIWRNPAGPRFGMIGAARQYRNTLLAAALLRQALEAAATWGSDMFTAEDQPGEHGDPSQDAAPRRGPHRPLLADDSSAEPSGQSRCRRMASRR